MSDKSDKSVCKTSENAGSEDEIKNQQVRDERLDIYSDKFDPVLALQTPNLQLPITNAKPFDNLAIFDSHLKKQQFAEAGPSQARKSKSDAPVFERRFLPHQMPIPTDKALKPRDTILSRWEMYSKFRGCLGALENARRKEFQVKVTIRHSHGIRGVCFGALVAYDKFWNVTLSSVKEYWIRRTKMRVPAFGEPVDEDDLAKLFPRERVIRLQDVASMSRYPSEHAREIEILASIMKSNYKKNAQLCERQVHELLIRGDQIVTIVLFKTKSNSKQKTKTKN